MARRQAAAHHYRWLDSLAGGEHPPRLCLERSSLAKGSFRLSRTWDLDAFILPVNSLAAHKEGFQLSYYPRYTKMITQDWHVLVKGYEARACKHIRLGRGMYSMGWDTYVFFPRRPLGAFTEARDQARSNRVEGSSEAGEVYQLESFHLLLDRGASGSGGLVRRLWEAVALRLRRRRRSLASSKSLSSSV